MSRPVYSQLPAENLDRLDCESGVVRQHAYVLVPVKGGFYALIYPATKEGYSRYEKQFIKLVNSFRPLTNCPGGAPYNP